MYRRKRVTAGLALLSLSTLFSGMATAEPAMQAEPFADTEFGSTWERTDKPVKDGTVSRTWFWGPTPNSAALKEPNKESPGGSRTVQYFDKSRMEVNDPNGKKEDPFYVTNGLLTIELVSGNMQVGASSYEQRYAACINITGDPGDPNAPTYAAMQRVSNTTLGDHPAASSVGQSTTATINARGDVGADQSKASIAAGKIAYYDDVTKHNVPAAFWTFLNSTGPVYENGKVGNAQLSNPWFYTSGKPISEPYWTNATIRGQTTSVMVQLFERRALTYVAGNPAGFQVEMANIGQHYYDWRYKNAGRCTPPVSGTVNFQAFGDPAELAVFQQVIAGYATANPSVKVNLIQVPAQGDHLSKLATSFAAGNPPDVFLINYRRYGQFANQNVLEPLGDYLDKSVTLRASDYYTQSLEAFTYQNTLQCIPQNISSLSIYYNKYLFQKYNVPLPKDGWTWQDMVSASKALTKDTDGDGKNDIYGFGVDTQLIRLAPFIWSNGGEIVDDYENPTKLTIDTPAAKEAFQAFVNLSLIDKVVPTQAEAKAQSGDARFLNGGLGMWVASRADTPTFRTIKNFTWDVASLPVLKTKATILHSDAYCMAAQSKNKEATWDFIQYALGPQGETIASKLGRIVPSLKTVANSPAYLDPTQPPANSKLYLDAIPTIRRVPISPVWGSIETIVNAEIDRAFYGGATVDQAIQAATQKANAEFAKVK
ncbi:MAG: sugar ABC transporter substrate-binding protein [Chloroflexota bacterium]